MDGTNNSTTFTDSSASAHTMTAVGNAKISTVQSKFGGAAGLFDGTNSDVSTPGSADFAMGTSDFTVDFWVNINSVAGSQWFQQVGATTNHFDIGFTNGTGLRVLLNGVEYDFAWTPTTGNWIHVAVSRSGTNLRAFIAGTQIGVTKTSSDNMSDSTSALTLGMNNSISWLNAYLDEYRISKGVARWTANFTPPTVAYS